MSRPDFPQAWDSTMLKSFRSCPQLMFKQYMHHWKPRSESIHLIAGKAFASGLEVMRRAYFERDATPEEALGLGLQALIDEYGPTDAGRFVKEAKSLERMAGALEYYAHVAFPLETDDATPVALAHGRRAIEFSFALELDPNLRHPVTGEPLLYCGRADQVVDYAGGVYVEDDKTTSTIGDRWAEQWKLRSQFTGYCWAGRQLWENVQGALVRGIAIRKTGYDHTQHPTPRPGALIDKWHAQSIRDIKRAIECWTTGYWDYDLDEACTHYGGCIFRDVCGSADEQPWLEAGFTRKVWNPILRLESEPENELAILGGGQGSEGFVVPGHRG